jgi:hypothetical protein
MFQSDLKDNIELIEQKKQICLVQVNLFSDKHALFRGDSTYPLVIQIFYPNLNYPPIL